MRYSVLTYIFNGYEKVHEVLEKDADAEYILVTDDASLKSDTWTVVFDDSLLSLPVFDRCYHVRFHPFRYVHSDIVIRIDGSFIVKSPLREIVDEFEKGNYDISLMIHPERCRIDEEYDIWVTQRQYSYVQAARCMAMMQSLGYDFGYRGLYQGGFIIQRNDKANGDFNDLTFAFLRYLGEREIERLDQTVSSFVLNSMFHWMKVMPVSECLITDSKFFQWCFHGSDRFVPNKEEKITPFLFNKQCSTLW